MSLHIFTTNSQPLTRYRVPDIEPPLFIRTPPHARATCMSCGRRREARNLRVKAYYDTTHIFCKEKCKRPPRSRRKGAK